MRELLGGTEDVSPMRGHWFDLQANQWVFTKRKQKKIELVAKPATNYQECLEFCSIYCNAHVLLNNHMPRYMCAVFLAQHFGGVLRGKNREQCQIIETPITCFSTNRGFWFFRVFFYFPVRIRVLEFQSLYKNTQYHPGYIAVNRTNREKTPGPFCVFERWREHDQKNQVVKWTLPPPT